MKEVKIIALVLCAAFILVTVVSNGFVAAESYEGINTDAAMSAFRPDTVMMSSGDLAVTWDEFYFYLHNTVSQLTYGFQEEVDLTEFADNGETWADMIKSHVIDQTTYTLAYGIGVRETGTSLNADELADIQTSIASMVDEYGSIEGLEAELRKDGFFNLNVYEKLLTQYMLQDKLPSVLYGENFSDISDEIVSDFAERNGYMCAKHILLVFPTESEGATPEEIESAKAEQHKKIEGILADLNAHKNDSNFDEYFDTAIQENSEDPGSLSFPDGYLFQFSDMVPEFSAACEALEPGKFSGIVESSYGYHIIYRLPLDFDNMVPYSMMYSGQYYTLRQLAVFEDYENVLNSWMDSLDIVYSKELEALDMSKIFVWH